MHSHTDILYSRMASCLASLDFSSMDEGEALSLANACEEAHAGLCHCVNYIGESLLRYEGLNIGGSKQFHLRSLGHSLTTLSMLLPMLTDFEQLIRSDIRNRDKDNLRSH